MCGFNRDFVFLIPDPPILKAVSCNLGLSVKQDLDRVKDRLNVSLSIKQHNVRFLKRNVFCTSSDVLTIKAY